MNESKIRSQQNVLFRVDTTQRQVGKWNRKVTQFYKKSIYSLSWKDFHKELHKLGIKKFLKHYGYSCKKQLQSVIAKSELSQERITLYNFEKNTEQELSVLLGNSFSSKVTRQPNFNAKNHPLSIIHYYMYYYSLHFTAVRLGFSSKQSFLTFFAQTQYVSECVKNRAQNLRASILNLYEVDPVTLREELTDLYDKPLAENENFIKYDYTLEELKLALKDEEIVFVVASLGGCNAFYVNKKLKTLNVNISLQDLKHKTWAELRQNIPTLLWKTKLYQLFSGKIPLEQDPFILSILRPLESDINLLGNFLVHNVHKFLTKTASAHVCNDRNSTESQRISAFSH